MSKISFILKERLELELGSIRRYFAKTTVKFPDGTVIQRDDDDCLDVTGFDWSNNTRHSPFLIDVTGPLSKKRNNIIMQLLEFQK